MEARAQASLNMLRLISVGKQSKSRKKQVETIPPGCQELNMFLREQELPRAKYTENGTGDNWKITCSFLGYQTEATGTRDEAKTPFLLS